jgi:hypothetical protein
MLIVNSPLLMIPHRFAVVIAAALVWLPLTAGLQQSQCQQAAGACKPLMAPFNYDGAYFRAELFDGESASLRQTFYSGMTYRIIPCGTSSNGGRLNVSVFDSRDVGVFHSRQQPGKNFFDIQFGATGTYRVEVRFENGEGCAAVLIGYKN